MTTGNYGALSAVVARQRGRARLRTATIAFGAAGLVAVGVVAYHLPSAATGTASATSAATSATGGGTSTVVHTVSGGSGVVTTTTTANGRPVTVPAAGAAHAASGGS
jgi:hypothetical protein